MPIHRAVAAVRTGLVLLGDATDDRRRVRDILESVPPAGEFTMTVLRLGTVIELKGKHLSG